MVGRQAHANDVAVQVDDVVDAVEEADHGFVVVPGWLGPVQKSNNDTVISRNGTITMIPRIFFFAHVQQHWRLPSVKEMENEEELSHWVVFVVFPGALLQVATPTLHALGQALRADVDAPTEGERCHALQACKEKNTQIGLLIFFRPNFDTRPLCGRS